MKACSYISQSCPSILQICIDLGYDIAEKDVGGHNCLFVSVLNSFSCATSDGLERLQYLLSIFDDIYARDTDGCTIFDHVDDARFDPFGFGSYRRDLWYCALKRASIDVSHRVANHPRKLIYDRWYTPEHYHALKHLHSWNEDNFRSQMDRLLQEIPLDEEEALEMERLRRKEIKRLLGEETDSDTGDEWDTSDEWEADDERTTNSEREANEYRHVIFLEEIPFDKHPTSYC